MVVATVRTVDVPFLGLDRGLQFVLGHFALADLGLVEQEVDDLVLIERGADLRRDHRILLDVFEEALAVFRAILLRRLADEHLHFLLRNLDAVLLADFRQQQAQAHAAHGDGAIVVLLGLDLLQRGLGVFLLAGFVLELLPDLAELGLDHRGRHVEIVRRGELVEQLALHLRAGQTGGLLLELAAQQALELLEAFEAQVLGEIVVDLGFARHLHRVDGDVEGGVLALEVLGRIVGREGDLDLALLAGLHADELVLEAGDQAAGAKLDRLALGGAAVEGDAIDLADEIDQHLIALGGFLAGLGVGEGLGARGDPLHRLFDLRVGDGDDQLLELQPVDRQRLDLRQHFERDGQLRILALFIALAQRDVGLHRGAQLVVGDQLVHRFTDGGVQRVLVERRAVHLLDEVGGHLAGAEAGHAHLRRHPLDLVLDARGDVLRGDRDRVAALQTLVGGLDNLHDVRNLLSNPCRFGAGGRDWVEWCGRRDSNPHILRWQDLNLLRLPIPPRPHERRSQKI